MNTIKHIGNIFYKFVVVVLLLLAGVAALAAFGIPERYRLFVVQTGSMEPTIKTGSIVLVTPQESYNVHDVVTFKARENVDLNNPKLTVTHRVVEKSTDSEQGISYVTKGDANETADFTPITHDRVVGRVVFDVPYVGYPVGFAKTQIGFVLLIVIPATIIVYNEILTIRSELRKRKEKRAEKQSGHVEDSDTTGKPIAPLSVAFLLVSASIVTVVSMTVSVFSDQEVIEGNTITAAEESPTPTPTDEPEETETPPPPPGGPGGGIQG